MLQLSEYITARKNQESPYVLKDGAPPLEYAQVCRTATRGARALAEWMEGPQNAALLAFPSGEFVAGYWGLVLSANTVLLANPRAARSELVQLIEHCDCNWILFDPQASEAAHELSERSGAGLIAVKSAEFSRVRSPRRLKDRENGSDVAVLAPTSGSTDRPKVAMLTHDNLDGNVAAHIAALKLRQDDVALIALPLSYSYAHAAQFLTHSRLGGAIVLYDSPLFFPKLFCEMIARHRVTVTCLVPSLLRMLDQYPYLADHDLSSLRYLCCGGAPLPEDVARSVIPKLPHTRFVHTYGLTEASPRVATLGPDDDLEKLPSIGRPVANVEVRILSHGRPVVPGNGAGELLLRGPGVMAGYYGAPDATREAIRNGWLHTGDLVYRDADGYLYLHGRVKRLIITGGVNVNPEEVENVLRTHSAIEDVLVEGEPSAAWGQIPVAFVVRKDPGRELTLERVHAFLDGQLAQWKWPKKLYYRTELPRTATGKIKGQSVH